MSFLVVLVVDDLDKVTDILHEWEQIGVPGITILESTGMGRIRRAGYRDDLPLMPSLQDLFEGEEIHHRTLFAVVEDEALVDRMIAAAEKVIGDLDEAHTGFLFVAPVVKVRGMGKHRMDRSQE
jgi:nitrogen regulatory protein PII